jgi:hypothetical protein
VVAEETEAARQLAIASALDVSTYVDSRALEFPKVSSSLFQW